MMLKKTLFIILTVFFNSVCFIQRVFKYKYEEGELYRIISEVNEDVYLNNVHSHSSKILNKIAVEVQGKLIGGKGLSARYIFQTSEKSIGKYSSYSLSNEYKSLFWRDADGKYDIEEKYYMPVVRNVPLFP